MLGPGQIAPNLGQPLYRGFLLRFFSIFCRMETWVSSLRMQLRKRSGKKLCRLKEVFQFGKDVRLQLFRKLYLYDRVSSTRLIANCSSSSMHFHISYHFLLSDLFSYSACSLWQRFVDVPLRVIFFATKQFANTPT